MKQQQQLIVIVAVIALLVIGIATSIYLFLRPEPVNVRKGVPWQNRMNGTSKTAHG